MDAVERLVLPLDVPSLAEARPWLDRLANDVGVFKVGLQLFTAAGPAALNEVHAYGVRSFLDLKLHDIPATMARATEAAVTTGTSYLTIHAAAGAAALKAVVAIAAGSDTQLLAVTVLTSMSADDLAGTCVEGSAQDVVLRRAELAVEAGISGLVCSPLECAPIRERFGRDLTLVVPGIRPEGSAGDDQTRRATPRDAIAAGADLLVVGRPIRSAADPVAAARAIVAEIAAAQ